MLYTGLGGARNYILQIFEKRVPISELFFSPKARVDLYAVPLKVK
jgi:hypothetical protein